MSQLTFSVKALELVITGTESTEMVFLDDVAYEFVGGGDAVNGY